MTFDQEIFEEDIACIVCGDHFTSSGKCDAAASTLRCSDGAFVVLRGGHFVEQLKGNKGIE